MVDAMALAPAGSTPAVAHATAAQILEWLGGISDPEIPAISIVDLGIVREVRWEGDACVVTITPTYSGCPAMTVIARDIEMMLGGHGVAEVRIETRLAPAWTTDWMSAKGKVNLHSYGIAPPRVRAIEVTGLTRRRSSAAIACPRCGSLATHVVSEFGSTSCKALYRCDACFEPFDYFKPH